MCLDASLADAPRTRTAAANQAGWRGDLHGCAAIVSCRAARRALGDVLWGALETTPGLGVRRRGRLCGG